MEQECRGLGKLVEKCLETCRIIFSDTTCLGYFESLVKEEAFKRSISKAEGNSFCTQVDFPVDLGPNRKNDLPLGYGMILAYMPPFYVKKWRSQCHFLKRIGRVPSRLHGGSLLGYT